jgi:hypothetical protein
VPGAGVEGRAWPVIVKQKLIITCNNQYVFSLKTILILTIYKVSFCGCIILTFAIIGEGRAGLCLAAILPMDNVQDCRVAPAGRSLLNTLKSKRTGCL